MSKIKKKKIIKYLKQLEKQTLEDCEDHIACEDYIEAHNCQLIAKFLREDLIAGISIDFED
jgi:hypothetical protein